MMHTDDEHLADVREVYAYDHERLWHTLYAFTGVPHLADEAAAEAFALAVRRGDAVRDLTASIWRSAFTIARGELAGHRSEAVLAEGHERVAAPGDVVDERVTATLGALDELTDTDRQLFVWCHVGGWTAKEVAPNVGMRATSIRVRLRRATRRVPGLPTGKPTPFDGVPAPHQWDDIVLRAWADESFEDRPHQRRHRPLALVVAVTAVIGLVGGLIVVTGASDTPAATSPPATSPPATSGRTATSSGPSATDPAALPSARIGGAREVTLPVSDVTTGSPAGTFRLRLYEAGGATFLEFEDIDLVTDERVETQVVEVDGQLRSETVSTPGSVGAIRMGDGTLTKPFRIRMSLTDASGSVVQQSPLVVVTPEL